MILLAALGGCSTPVPSGPSTRAVAGFADPLDAARAVVSSPDALPSNSALARDFVELSFQLETGRKLERFTRFEGPVRVRLSGDVPPTAPADLSRLVQRLGNEAGIPITLAAGPANEITVNFVPRRALQAEVPNAACFVVPNVASWQDYQINRRSPRTDWSTLRTRQTAAVFIPAEASPQEVRDCLHEEISQALGPLNDLYRLPNSIWNDDNFQTVLTRYDMLQLRATYAPELHSGMTALPAIYARINPAGGPVRSLRADPTPRAYVDAIETAMGANTTPAGRRAAASRAVSIASSWGWNDTRTAFAWFALGRLNTHDDASLALRAFANAGAIYRATPGAGMQSAHVDMQLAAFALKAGRAQDALGLVDRALANARKGENAALLATLYLIKAEASDALGAAGSARQARLDSARWARYGFGSDVAVRTRAAGMVVLAQNGTQGN